ncbi:MAG: c-type cytochrome domain-containing protein [Bacteroidota bacterium]
MDTFITFLGRFHPLVVHLPIGILILAFMMEVASRWKAYEKITVAIPFALLLGSVSAVGAALLGYLLSFSGDYDPSTLWWHQWLGIGVAVLGFVCYYLKVNSTAQAALISQSVLMIVLTVAGHNGGNLTHGSTYLTEYAPWKQQEEKLPPPTSVDSAFVFQHLVQPILEKKCVSCHNQGKQKGQLRMDTPEYLLRGGQHGPILVAGNLEESEMYRRITLPQENEEFMPPDGKTPLTEEEFKIVEWWIKKAAITFDKKVAEINGAQEMRPVFSNKLNLQKTVAKVNFDNTLILEKIKQLGQLGFVVRPLVGDYQMVEVTMRDAPTDVNTNNLERLKMLEPIASQVVWLNLTGQKLDNNDLTALQGLENLQRLKLSDNPISDEGIQKLTALKKLESLNLYQTDVSPEVLPIISSLEKLKKIFLWNTKINEANAADFRAQYPNKELVFGVTH